MGWLATALAALEIAKKAYEIGKDVAPIIAKITAILTKGESATEQDLSELRAMSDALSDEIQQPLQPEQD